MVVYIYIGPEQVGLKYFYEGITKFLEYLSALQPDPFKDRNGQ